MPLTGNGVKTEFGDQVLTVYLTGEIDHHNAGKMRLEIDEEICRRRPKRVILDLGSIDFMDSSGLGFVLGRLRKMNELKGTVTVVNPARRVEEMLRMAGAEKLVKIVHSDRGDTETEK